jgi:gamma-glutamylcyclotransferase (GGCT)/AIG2-like uncharacterized protein YtfP
MEQGKGCFRHLYGLWALFVNEYVDMSCPLLATYGTLMRDFEMHERLGVEGHLTFVERCRWRGVLYDLGRFPGAVPGTEIIRGDLFRVESSDVLRTLDEYEGYDPERASASLFLRQHVRLVSPDRVAWVYWFNGDPGAAPRVPSGDWAAYVHEEKQ